MYGITLSFESIAHVGLILTQQKSHYHPSNHHHYQFQSSHKQSQSSPLSLLFLQQPSESHNNNDPPFLEGKDDLQVEPLEGYQHKLSKWVDFIDQNDASIIDKIVFSSNKDKSVVGVDEAKHSSRRPNTHSWLDNLPPPPRSTRSKISWHLLQQQTAETSNAIIEHFQDSPSFQTLAAYEGELTIQRDKQDTQKLQRGIDFAISKGVLAKNNKTPQYCDIDVLGKTPDQVATDIINQIESCDETPDEEGLVIVICGLSGTGKGTTVAQIRQQLLARNPNRDVVTWSNGNIFRSLTLLAVTWSERQQQEEGGVLLDKESPALTRGNLQSFVDMLSFGRFNGNYDTRIQGMGMDVLVSETENTILKAPKVAKNIPTVAEFTQGEVISFAADAMESMRQDGIYVLVEGREQTVNYIPTKHRFTLTLSDPSLIGKRRAAQRIMAHALRLVEKNESNNKKGEETTNETIEHILQTSLEDLSRDLSSPSTS